MEPEVPESTKFRRSRLACLRCRSKKLKCDGNTPCSLCIRSIHNCSYEEKRKPTLSEKALTEKLAALQSRYDELAEPGIPEQSVYAGAAASVSFPPNDTSKSKVPVATPSPNLERIEATVTTELRDLLIATAMIYLPRCNFDIDSQRIFEGLKLPAEKQPHPALINAIMLFGTYFSESTPDQPLLNDCPPTEYFVQEIRDGMVAALSDVDRLLDYMTASVMLAWWFLQNGRWLEAHYLISSTARLGIDCGLHQIDEQTVKSVFSPETEPMPLRQVASILGPPSDLSDLEIRVGVFWGIYLGDRSASLTTGLPAAFDAKTSNSELEITTVFQRRSGHFADPWTPSDFCSIDDLMGFAQVPSATPKSFKAVITPQTAISAYSQAMTLLFRGVRLSSFTPENLLEALEHRDALCTLNQAMQRFTSQLPREATVDEIQCTAPPYVFGSEFAHPAFFALAQVRCMAYVIIIHMHQAAEQLRDFEGVGVGVFGEEGKKMAAAHAGTGIAEQILEELSKPECNLTVKDGLCVVMGYMWSIIASVYATHIAKLRGTLSIGTTNTELQLCEDNLLKLRSALKRLAQVFPVLDLQVQKVESSIKGTVGSP